MSDTKCERCAVTLEPHLGEQHSVAMDMGTEAC